MPLPQLGYRFEICGAVPRYRLDWTAVDYSRVATGAFWDTLLVAASGGHPSSQPRQVPPLAQLICQPAQSYFRCSHWHSRSWSIGDNPMTRVEYDGDNPLRLANEIEAALANYGRGSDHRMCKAIHFFEGELRLICECLRCAGPQKAAKQPPGSNHGNGHMGRN